jgi:hypothetical protein
MLPAEIGAAGAYEAYRQYCYNISQSRQLNALDARRDALLGLAVAEGE